MGITEAVYPDRPAAERVSSVILKQRYLGCLVRASYLIADRVGGTAAVIDPHGPPTRKRR
jgi:hypothetical protein